MGARPISMLSINDWLGECPIRKRTIHFYVACLHLARLSKARGDCLTVIIKVFFATAAVITDTAS